MISQNNICISLQLEICSVTHCVFVICCVDDRVLQQNRLMPRPGSRVLVKRFHGQEIAAKQARLDSTERKTVDDVKEASRLHYTR